MNMFCYQCQETGNRKGCTYEGVCGKTDETANLQDTLIYSLKGLAYYIRQVPDVKTRRDTGMLAAECLFATVTNTNFDSARIVRYIRRVLEKKDEIKEMAEKAHTAEDLAPLPEITPNAAWDADNEADIYQKSLRTGVLDIKDPDERSVKETIVYGMKGLSAYTYHAGILGFFDDSIFDFIFEGLYRTSIQTSMEDLMDLVFKTGEITFRAMKILDQANSETYGIPSPVLVKTGTGDRPGILVSGHELKDLERLLEQSAGEGVDIYTHGEMIPGAVPAVFQEISAFEGQLRECLVAAGG